MDDEQLYEIEEGVRRAKAAQLCGQETVRGRIGGDPVFDVPVKNLRSPHKSAIDLAGTGGFRWRRILRATQAGENLPPIQIMPGGRGPTIEEVSVPDAELDIFR